MSTALLVALGFGAAGVGVLWIVDEARKRFRRRGAIKRSLPWPTGETPRAEKPTKSRISLSAEIAQ
jgi:hypothetical protein